MNLLPPDLGKSFLKIVQTSNLKFSSVSANLRERTKKGQRNMHNPMNRRKGFFSRT